MWQAGLCRAALWPSTSWRPRAGGTLRAAAPCAWGPGRLFPGPGPGYPALEGCSWSCCSGTASPGIPRGKRCCLPLPCSLHPGRFWTGVVWGPCSVQLHCLTACSPLEHLAPGVFLLHGGWKKEPPYGASLLLQKALGRALGAVAAVQQGQHSLLGIGASFNMVVLTVLLLGLEPGSPCSCCCSVLSLF